MARVVALCAAAFIAALLLASCDGDGGQNGNGTPHGPITITLWHSMGSPLSNSLQSIADRFNQSQSKYKVELIYQGSYTDSLTKLINSIKSHDVPTMIQLDDVSTQIMIDSEEIKPVQDFIDEEHYDLSDFDPKALSYYTVDGTLYSMPFNLAGPILYYDKQAFRDAGLDPEKPPRTLEEVRQYSEKLLIRDSSGTVTRSGIALQVSPWIFEQMLAEQGELYVNGDNGRTGRATKALFDSEAGKQVLRWYKDLVDSGLGYYAGTKGIDAMLTIPAGRAAMAMESTAGLGIAVALVAATGADPKERLGTGPLPAPAGSGGIVLGGASFWILGRQPEEKQRGAWEFMKFAASPEQQAQWHAETGYFPTRLSAYDLPVAKQRREQFPQFETAVTQLRESPDTPATDGALVGPFKSVRDRITRAFEQVLGSNTDPDQELEAAAKDATDMMKEYNRTAP